MVKKKIQITSKSFDLSQIEDFHLSIQLSLDGFSFCIVNKIKQEIVCLLHYDFSDYNCTPEKHLEYVKEVFQIEPILQYKFSSVNVTHANLLSALVPQPLFNENDLSGYMKFGHKIYKNDFITFDTIPSHDLINVYIPLVLVNNFLLDRFGTFEYEHASTVLIKNILNTFKYSEHPHMFVTVNENDFNILAISSSRLQLYNSFRYGNRNDFIYYLLFAVEQLNFNPNTFNLVFLGKTLKDDEIYNITYKYVRNVGFMENRNKFNLIEEITDDLQRQFFTLLHQF